MANTNQQSQNRRRLNKKEVESLIPFIREFNKLAKSFINILNHRVEDKERRIAVLVSSMKIPEKNHSINIQTVDIKNTLVSKKGSYFGRETMSWEDDVLRNMRRGSVI